MKYNTESFREAARKKHNGKYILDKAFFIRRNIKTTFICPEHGEFHQTPAAHLQGQGCPKCAKQKIGQYKKLTQEECIGRFREIHGTKYDYSDFVYVNMHTHGKIICPVHGVFEQTPANHIAGCGCPKCAGLKLTREEVIEKFNKIHHNKYDYSETFFDKLSDETSAICTKHGKFRIIPSKHLEGHGCPKCAREHTADINRVTDEEFIQRGNELHSNKYNYDRLVLKNMSDYVEIGCPEHGYFKQMANDHLRGRGCPICGKHISHAEEEIVEYIKNLIGNENVIIRDRGVLNGQELDIYIPYKELAIEYNGNYWHSEAKGRDAKYHLNKLEKCNDKRIKLIQIFEDEWINHKDIVLSKIRHIVNRDERILSVYGRKCYVREINKKLAKEFLESNHIQGNGNSSVCLGAFNEDELVAVMTFKKVKNDEWELNRFASDIKKRCVGVGGKLFKHFINNYNPEKVKSFADRRWTVNKEDNLYTKLGFSLVKIIPPDYRYIRPGNSERIHKFNCRKQTLHKKYGLPLSLTETQMCSELGFYKIWDCGLFKYQWEKVK